MKNTAQFTWLLMEKTADDVTIFKKNEDNRYWENSKYFTTDIKSGILFSLESKCFFQLIT